MVNTNQKWIERVEEQRDLRSQLKELDAFDDGEEKEIQMSEWSPGRKMVQLWSMETGEEIWLPRYQALAAINSYQWTAHSGQAPRHRLGSVKCFMHKKSPYREILVDMGLIDPLAIGCTSEHHPSEAAMWGVARTKHATMFKNYQDELERRERKAAADRQEQQTSAMLAMAQNAAQQGKEQEADNEEQRRGPGRPRKEPE